MGNTYSGAVPLALSNVLDKAEPGDKIFIVSYGSGAGSDGFTLTVNDRIEEVKNLAPTTEEILSKEWHRKRIEVRGINYNYFMIKVKK